MQNMFPSRNPLKQVRLSAVLLVAGSLLQLVGFILHPQDYPSATKTAPVIAAHAGAWMLAHWILAVGGILLSAACFMLARARYGPTRFPAGRRAFVAFGVSSLLAIEIFVLEATLAVRYGKAGDVSALEGLLLPELPGIVGLLGLSAAGAWVFVTQARDDCPVLPTAVNWVAAVAGVVGLVGTIGFGAGSEAVAMLQYANGLVILALAVLGVKALAASRPSKAPASSAKPGMG